MTQVGIGPRVDLTGLEVDGSGNVIVSQYSVYSPYAVLKLTLW